MSRLARLVAGGLALLALGGCLPESRNPIAPPSAAFSDPRIPGIWMLRSEDETLYLHVLQGDDNIYDFVSVNHRADGRGAADLYQGYLVKVGDRAFVNLRAAGDDGPAPTYFFASYALEGADALVVRFLAEQPMIDAIAAGRLDGETASDALGRNILLTDEPARIAAFLAEADEATLFDQPLTFRRLAMP